MMHEDDQPKRPAARLTPPVLDSWGVEELRLYINELQAEIGRVEAAIARRGADRSAADAFFSFPKGQGG